MYVSVVEQGPYSIEKMEMAQYHGYHTNASVQTISALHHLTEARIARMQTLLSAYQLAKVINSPSLDELYVEAQREIDKLLQEE